MNNKAPTESTTPLLDRSPPKQPAPNTSPRRSDADELKIFRHGVGLALKDPDLEGGVPDDTRCITAWIPFLHNSYGCNAKPPSDGLYGKILAEECSAAMQYYPCTLFINFSLIIQVLIAATVTALGASASSHKVITVLGATNTVVAGLLALLKGHGLPNRIRQDMVGLRKVRDFIEDRECDFERWGEGWSGGSAKDAVQKAREMYEIVRTTMENNRSDSYIVHGEHGEPDTDARGDTL